MTKTFLVSKPFFKTVGLVTLLISLILFSGTSYAAKSCGLFKGDASELFWKQDKRLQVEAANGSKAHLTLSFDSEIEVSTAFRLLLEHPDKNTMV